MTRAAGQRHRRSSPHKTRESEAERQQPLEPQMTCLSCSLVPEKPFTKGEREGESVSTRVLPLTSVPRVTFASPFLLLLSKASPAQGNPFSLLSFSPRPSLPSL